MGKASPKDEEKKGRKVSCQSCRLKKVKCDGNKPCARCHSKGIDCTFAKPAPVGRPPKNAVVNKLVLTRGNETASNSSLCKEFIFEHISCPNLPSDATFLYCGRGTGLKFYLNDIFTTYFGPHNTASQKLSLITNRNALLAKVAGTFKLYDLKQTFTWDTSDIVNIMIRRFGKIRLESYNESEFLQWALVIDHSKDFFTLTPDNHTPINPLNSLPPQQALHLIETFFLIHPYSHLINKTLLLQSYWTDTADPLLLSVIYGTTIYMSRLLEGKPLSLWETLTVKSLRNPFLEYSHYLLSKSTAEISVIRYQALIILALFEVTFGYAKRGVSLFALAHIMASKLGVFEHEKFIISMTAVERETLLWTFWAGFNCTVRGCIELNQVPREVLTRCLHPLPPHSIHVSESHKSDRTNGNQRLNKYENYLVETFYAESIIARFSSKIFAFYPDTKENLFRPPNAYYGKSWSTAVATTPLEVEIGIAQVLQSFAMFIEQHKNEWTAHQRYTIEGTLLLYSIHFKFLKRQILESQRRSVFEDKDIDELDPNDIENVARMHQALPFASLLLEKSQEFIATNGSKYQQEPQTMPIGILIASMETCARIFMMKYDRDPWDKKTWLDIQRVYTLATNAIWPEWSSIDVIRRMLREYIEAHADIPFANPDLAATSDTLIIYDPNKLDFDLALSSSSLSSSFSSSPTALLGYVDNLTEFGWPDENPGNFLQETDSVAKPWSNTLDQILALDDDLFEVL